MTTAYAVIGGNYGDEGKGLITDYLTRIKGAKIVARFNGGAQAGHTVVTPYGQSHVFGHVSAGTFAGADTYLSGHFIVNPYLLEMEMEQLAKKGFRPSVYAYELARVTTIYDMALNAAAELARGDGRHGSCGIGINETVTRDDAGFQIELVDFSRAGRNRVEKWLKLIHNEWVPERLKQLGITDLPESFHMKTGEVLRNNSYEEHAARMLHGLQFLTIVDYIETNQELSATDIILEGAQGLALDEDLGVFPHVTRSKTGLPYAMSAADDFKVETLQPIYITRAYSTRHGAGPFAHEGEVITENNLMDYTNVENQWQGRLRYAPLDLRQMKALINSDLDRAADLQPGYDTKVLRPVVAVTCLDQLGQSVAIYDVTGQKQVIDRQKVTSYISEQLEMPVALQSWGSTAAQVVQTPGVGV